MAPCTQLQYNQAPSPVAVQRQASGVSGMALVQYDCMFCSLFITNAGVAMQLFNALYITLDDNAQVPALGAPAICLLLDSIFWSTCMHVVWVQHCGIPCSACTGCAAEPNRFYLHLPWGRRGVYTQLHSMLPAPVVTWIRCLPSAGATVAASTGLHGPAGYTTFDGAGV